MNKKTIAREWLYFLGFNFVGFVVLPTLLILLFGGQVGDFYEDLFEGHWAEWLIVPAPYLLFQLVRSVLWALRESRE